MNDTKQPKATLSRIQARALPILLSASSIAVGCRRAGISRDRFYDWMKQESFREAYETASREVVTDAIRSLKLLAGQSVEVLSRLLRARSESVRFKTAYAVIDSLTKFIEMEEIEGRLSELERTVQKNTNDDY